MRQTLDEHRGPHEHKYRSQDSHNTNLIPQSPSPLAQTAQDRPLCSSVGVEVLRWKWRLFVLLCSRLGCFRPDAVHQPLCFVVHPPGLFRPDVVPYPFLTLSESYVGSKRPGGHSRGVSGVLYRLTGFFRVGLLLGFRVYWIFMVEGASGFCRARAM